MFNYILAVLLKPHTCEVVSEEELFCTVWLVYTDVVEEISTELFCFRFKRGSVIKLSKPKNNIPNATTLKAPPAS